MPDGGPAGGGGRGLPCPPAAGTVSSPADGGGAGGPGAVDGCATTGEPGVATDDHGAGTHDDRAGTHDRRAAATTAAPPTTAAPVAPARLAGGGLAVGDSVLEDVQLYAPTTLASRGISFNAAVSRQWRTGETILSSVRAAGKLPPVVIVALGTNGPIHPADFDAMMQAAAGSAKVVFMTVTGPSVANNPVIAAGVARYPQARLADWAAVSAPHPDWFAGDRVHVGPAGAAALGSLLASLV